MLWHLIGAANRADIRRLTLLERDNAQWRERVESQQARIAELSGPHREHRSRFERLTLENTTLRSKTTVSEVDPDSCETELRQSNQQVLLQTRRREVAEQAVVAALAAQREAQQDADRMRRLNAMLSREVEQAESRFQALAEPEARSKTTLAQAVEGWKIAYVGGRPSSTPSIRQFVNSSWIQVPRSSIHDGSMEDRKGLLARAVASASLVMFPIDCVDHDSMNQLKRLCARHGVPFLALRTASVTCFAAALSAFTSDAPAGPDFQVCLRHG